MSGFTLDTSGFVQTPPGPGQGGTLRTRWPDLDPFTRGYIEALFASVFTPFEPQGENPFRLRDPKRWRFVGFSDLAPEALALILKDCARFRVYGAREFFDCIENTPKHGAHFWTGRNSRLWPSKPATYQRDGFPPLTPYLREDGKFDLRERAA